MKENISACGESTFQEAIPCRQSPGRTSLWRRFVQGIRKIRERADWKTFIPGDWPSQIMNVPVTDNLNEKQGRSTGRLMLKCGEQTLSIFLKRHYELPRWRGLLAALLPGVDWSPAMHEWRNLQWAEHHGIPVPPLVCAGEFLEPWGKLQSFLAIEELAGMIPLHQAVPLAYRQLDPAKFAQWKKGLIQEMARLTTILHKQRYFHKDLYFCHFFIPRELTWSLPQWRGNVHVIDLHRLSRHALSWPLMIVKDLGQLLFSSDLPGVTAKDRLYFWHCYKEVGLRPFSRETISWWVRYKANRYQRHNVNLQNRPTKIAA